MDPAFLESTGCYFGGGTCLALRLGEFRESVDIDFLCASTAGYRAIRGTVSNISLGRLFVTPPRLLRDVRFDRYGIRTVISIGDIPIKFEIVLEGRVDLDCEHADSLPVPVLDRISLFTEKLLANSDRWADRSVYARDIIDLLVMIESWGEIPKPAWEKARDAYGATIDVDFERAVQGLRNDTTYLEECFVTLEVEASTRQIIRDRCVERGL